MPFLLGVLHGAWGWALFGVVWAAAVLGIVSKLLDRLKHPLWSTGLYVAMGWVALIAVAPLVERMSVSGLAWLVAGGLSYTAAAVVFLFDSKLRCSDRDVFVVGGLILHYDRQGWTTVGTTHYAHKVWGSGPGDVYVTEGDRILHYGVTQ